MHHDVLNIRCVHALPVDSIRRSLYSNLVSVEDLGHIHYLHPFISGVIRDVGQKIVNAIKGRCLSNAGDGR